MILAFALDTVIRSLHLIAAGIWVGGLVFMAVAVGAARGTVAESDRIALFRSLGWRFVIVGGIALAVLIATGTDMSVDRLSSWSDLLETDYGRRLSEKLSLIALVIVATAVHSFIQGPALSRLRKQAMERPDDAQLAALIRRKNVRAGAVSALILLATLAIVVMAASMVAG